MRLTGNDCSLDLTIAGFEDPNESPPEHDDYSWLSVAAIATTTGGKTVHASLSFQVYEARAFLAWLRDAARFASSGSLPPSLFWTIEPGFAANATAVRPCETAFRFFVYDPQSTPQPLPEVDFPALVVDVRSDDQLLGRSADEWDAVLRRVAGHAR